MHMASCNCLGVLILFLAASCGEAAYYLKEITQRDDGLHLVSTNDPAFNKTGYNNKFSVDIHVFTTPNPDDRFVLYFYEATLSAQSGDQCNLGLPNIRVEASSVLGYVPPTVYCNLPHQKVPLYAPITSNTSNAFRLTFFRQGNEKNLVKFAYKVDTSCAEKGCAEGSTCQLWKPGQARCLCPAGKGGELCDRGEICVDNPCQNANKCTDVHAGTYSAFKCSCQRGYKGKYCEEFVSMCRDSQCGGDDSRGKCITDSNSEPKCECKQGYWGEQCQYSQCDKLNICSKGSICMPTKTGPQYYECVCPPMIYGDYCTSIVTFKSTDDCTRHCISGQGHCVNAGQETECVCEPGFAGTYCDVSLIGKYTPKTPYDVCKDRSMVCGAYPCIEDSQSPDSYSCSSFASTFGERSGCYYGPCGEEDNVCEDNVYSNHKHSCQCQNSESGSNCQFPTQDTLLEVRPRGVLDECAKLACDLSSTCQLEADGAYKCVVGGICDTAAPCKNDGSCTEQPDLVAKFRCDCATGWSGPTCEAPDNACVSKPCGANGTCSLGGDRGFTCACAEGWIGARCTDRTKPCSSNPCQNDALCLDTGTPYTCQCKPGFTGRNCETNIDDCSPTPCDQSGSTRCEDLINGYKCHCKAGYTGKECDTKVDLCVSMPCLNQGTCSMNGDTDYKCACPPGHTGSNCEISETDPCSRSPCGPHGDTCVTKADNSFECTCKSGWRGALCDVGLSRHKREASIMSANPSLPTTPPTTPPSRTTAKPDSCTSTPCLNNGACLPLDANDFKCICKRGWKGSKCETRNYVCPTRNLCKNGKCVDVLPTKKNGVIIRNQLFRCDCDLGWEGFLCNKEIDYCKDQPCQNNGTCFNEVKLGGYSCTCPVGFTGQNCTEVVDFCKDDPCVTEHTEKCISGASDYSCECKLGYKGEKCQTNIDECDPDPCVHGSCVDQINGYTCNCKAGYTDVNCTTDINECSSNPCQNNATCNDLIGKYDCVCPKGYKGDRCETQIDYCETKPCKAGSTCINKIGSYECVCQPGFIGQNCLVNFDDCESQPCRNGATCTDKIDGFTCNCAPGYTGDECASDINECTAQAHICENNGTCINNLGSYMCSCRAGFTGENCQTNIDDCTSQPCKNGATCQDQVNAFRCICQPGFNGRFCDNNQDECNPNPCKYGNCTDEVNGYTCQCEPGWTGKDCNENIDNCVGHSCNSGSTCLDGIDMYTCLCSAGYTGQFCSEVINACESSPCVANHTRNCTDTAPGLYACNCFDGYTGPTCERDIDECSNRPCKHGGTCADLVNGYSCACVEGWSGTTCEVDTNECVTQSDGTPPCLNNGICQDNFNGYTCVCQQGYNGTRCENEIDFCANTPCENNARCISTRSGYGCVCANGFTGTTCSENIDECRTQPCLYGATCNDLIGDYSCSCVPGYAGKQCQTNIDECASSPCQNEGICQDRIDLYQCKCQTGYNSTNCENKIDWCAASTCTVNSNCTSGLSDYTCDCFPGYEGKDCSSDIDECEDTPCKNGANCTDLINDYACQCIPGWQGKDCDINIDECASQPCQHNSTCVDQVNSYKCLCADGYNGINCETDKDECAAKPCLHEGNCTDLVNDFHCDCPPGFIDRVCSTDIDECESSPCQNGGICNNLANMYKCGCSEYFDGPNCEIAAELNGACLLEGNKKESGDSWKIDCNECECVNGTISCTRLWCGWEICTEENTTMITSEVCETCAVPPCLNDNCTITNLCYDRPYLPSDCLEDECLNTTLSFNFDMIAMGLRDEGLCKDLRRRLLGEKDKFGEAPVRIECTWAGEDSTDIDFHIRTEGNPGLAAKIEEMLQWGSVNKDGLIIVNEYPKQQIDIKNNQDFKLPMIVGIVCGIILIIGITIIIVYKRRLAPAPKDVWVSKSRQPTRGKSQKQQLVPEAEPAEFMNPTFAELLAMEEEEYDTGESQVKVDQATERQRQQNQELMRQMTVGHSRADPVIYSVPDKCNTLPAKAHIDAGDYSYQDPLSVYSLADSLRESDTPIHYDTLPSNHHMGGPVEDYDIPLPAERGTLPPGMESDHISNQYLYANFDGARPASDMSSTYDTPNPANMSNTYDTPSPLNMGAPPTESPLPPPPSMADASLPDGEGIYDVPRH